MHFKHFQKLSKMVLGLCMHMDDKCGPRIAYIIANHYESSIFLQCYEKYSWCASSFLIRYRDLTSNIKSLNIIG